MKRTLWTAGAIGALLLVALGYLRLIHDPHVRAIAGLEAARDSLHRALESLAVRETARALRDTGLARQTVRVRVRVDTVLVRASAAESIFARALPDSLQPGFRAVVALKDSVIADLTRIIDTQEQRLALRDTSLTETRAALAEALTQRDRYRKVANPSLVLRVLRAAPKVAVAAGVGYLLGRR